MKKSILAILLALVMVASLLPFGALADGAINEISTLDGLKNALSVAQDGDTVRLLGNIDVFAENLSFPDDDDGGPLVPILYINTDITLDLNGFKIGYDQSNLDISLQYTPCLICINGADVVITGNGTIDAEAKNNNA